MSVRYVETPNDLGLLLLHQAFNFLFGSFGLLSDVFPFYTILDTSCPIFYVQCITLSSHLCLGLPLGLVVRGVHLKIFLAVLESGNLCTCPSQLSLKTLM